MNTINTLTTWNPLKRIENLGSLQNRLNTLFGRNLTSLEEDMSYSSDWLPSVDITEDDKEYTLTAELPEVKREDLHVRLHNGSISLTGERKRETEEQSKTYHRLERKYGKFERTFTVPENTIPDTIKAEFKGGTLQIHLPKDKQANSNSNKKEITIS